jgi:Dolichyl-phosphate-mannose-protein mannosyltransferase
MFGPNSKVWMLGLFVALGVLSWGLFRNFTGPWIDRIDFNGACWSQSAHNTLRAGLLATAGVPSAFYFGPLPIPPSGYYAHHPPLLSLTLTGMFAVLGEKEWVARLLPIAFSLVSVVLLWMLMKDCAGRRAATFGTMLFAAMPMELFYGRMVNFEPINLVWMLGALLCLRRWEQTGGRGWRNGMLAAIVLSLWTAWLGYVFVVILCVHYFTTRAKRNRPLALLLLGLCVVSIVLFLLQVHSVQPAPWRDLIEALNRRMGSQSGANRPNFAWKDWEWTIGATLLTHIHAVIWALAVIGLVLLLGCRNRDEGLRWLGWAALCFFALNSFYIVTFRNASYIHPYASFYFMVPVAIAGGIAVEAFACWCEWRSDCARIAGFVAIAVMYGLLIFNGERQAFALNKRFRILDWNKPEPASLIPELGRKINEKTSKDAMVICNFFADYGPQLEYYAQRTIFSCNISADGCTNVMSQAALFSQLRQRRNISNDEWRQLTRGTDSTPVAGVIWLGKRDAGATLAALPSGSREEINVQGCSFCFWIPYRQRLMRTGETFHTHWIHP